MIRNHSHYSLLLALSKPEEIVDKAKELGYGYVGLTDYNTVAGSVELVQACKKKGLKPLIGAEIQLDVGTLTLICRNKLAWNQLIQVISTSNNKENYVKRPTIKFADLISIIDPNNFVCIDGYLGSRMYYQIYNDVDFLVLDQDLMKRDVDLTNYVKEMSVFSHYFLESASDQYESYPLINEMSNILPDVPKINNSASYYQTRESSVLHRILLCSKLKCTLRGLEPTIAKENSSLCMFMHSSSFYIKNTGDFSVIADLCETFDILSKPRLPKFECPDGFTEIEYLKQLCRNGWVKKLLGKNKIKTKEDSDKYKDRVLSELGIIEMAGLAGYFLIVQDYVNYAKKNGSLVGCGRGSAGGCLVSYLLDITNVDPIEYDLMFYRFFNPSRSFPDHVSFNEYKYLGDFLK